MLEARFGRSRLSPDLYAKHNKERSMGYPIFDPRDEFTGNPKQLKPCAFEFCVFHHQTQHINPHRKRVTILGGQP